MLTADSTFSAAEFEAQTRAWIASQLLHGRAAGWVKDKLCTAGIARDVASAAVDDASASPYLQAALTQTKRGRKTDELLEVYTRMWRRSGEAKRVPEVLGLSEKDFAERFYYRNRPVIVRGSTRHWPAVASWTPSAFKERFGDVAIEYMHGPTRYRGRQNAPHRTMMAEFADRVASTRASNDFYVVATNLSLRRCADLMPLTEDLRPLEFLPDVDLRDPDVVNLWFGPRGTVTPLHHDVTSVVLTQVYGRKQVLLAPSFALPLLYNCYGVYSDVDPIVIDRKRFPRAASVPWLKVDLAPGDALFIPVGWWHWVYALQTSISVSIASFAVDGIIDRLESFHGALELSTDSDPPFVESSSPQFQLEAS